MGLDHLVAYNLGRQQGGGGGPASTGLVIIMGAIIVMVGILWAVSTVLSFVWSLVYGTVRPLLMLFPPVTVPAGVVLLAAIVAKLSPYAPETTLAYLDGNDDRMPFEARTALAVGAVNLLLLVGYLDAFPELDGLAIVPILLTLGFLVVALYGFFELLHLPYRCVRLVRHAPRGHLIATAFLTPMSYIFVTPTFDVSPTAGYDLPAAGAPPEAVVGIVAFAVFNLTYVGGPLAVKLNESHIRAAVNADVERARAGSPDHSGESTTDTGEPRDNPDTSDSSPRPGP